MRKDNSSYGSLSLPSTYKGSMEPVYTLIITLYTYKPCSIAYIVLLELIWTKKRLVKKGQKPLESKGYYSWKDLNLTASDLLFDDARRKIELLTSLSTQNVRQRLQFLIKAFAYQSYYKSNTMGVKPLRDTFADLLNILAAKLLCSLYQQTQNAEIYSFCLYTKAIELRLYAVPSKSSISDLLDKESTFLPFQSSHVVIKYAVCPVTPSLHGELTMLLPFYVL